MKATDLLKQQHREVEDLFRQLETAEDDEERSSLREELANKLAAHTSIEEEIFYPAAMEAIGPTARVREALEEHAVADFALYRLLSVSPSDETFQAKLGCLKDVVMNHVEEEESELLPQADGEMDQDKLEAIGEKLTARFDERMMEGHRAILERSLGITMRAVAQAAPGAKKAAARPARAPAKRQVAQKRGRAATKQAAAPAQKRGGGRAAATKKANGGATAGRGQAAGRGQTAGRVQTTRKVAAGAGKTTPARGQGVSRTAGAGAGAGRGQAGARGGAKQAPRGSKAQAGRKRAGR